MLAFAWHHGMTDWTDAVTVFVCSNGGSSLQTFAVSESDFHGSCIQATFVCVSQVTRKEVCIQVCHFTVCTEQLEGIAHFLSCACWCFQLGSELRHGYNIYRNSIAVPRVRDYRLRSAEVPPTSGHCTGSRRRLSRPRRPGPVFRCHCTQAWALQCTRHSLHYCIQAHCDSSSMQ